MLLAELVYRESHGELPGSRNIDIVQYFLEITFFNIHLVWYKYIWAFRFPGVTGSIWQWNGAFLADFKRIA